MISTLLFIIFGTKTRDKEYGPSYPIDCPRCTNEVYYQAYKWRTWFHIFWIPLIPWTANRELVCPICGAGFELDKGEFDAATELIEATQRYREQQLSEQAYAQSVRDFEAVASFVDGPTDGATPDERAPESKREQPRKSGE